MFKLRFSFVIDFNLYNNLALSSKLIPITLVNNILLPKFNFIDAGIYKIVYDYTKYSKNFISPIYHFFIIKHKLKFSDELRSGNLNIVYKVFNFLFLSSVIMVLLIIYFRYGLVFIDNYIIISILLCYLLYRVKIKNDTYFTFNNFSLTFNISKIGIPSVMQTINSILASIASIIAAAANFAGT